MKNQDHDPKPDSDSKPEPVTRELGPHTVGSGIRAAGGVLAGAATGTAVDGSVRAVVVGAIGVATDALAGQSAPEAVNLTAEDSYWSEKYLTRSYVERNRPYADYRPAYRYGCESRARFGNRPFHKVESELGRGWDEARGVSKLVWMQAQNAAGDAWHRAGRAVAREETRSDNTGISFSVWDDRACSETYNTNRHRLTTRL